MRRWPASSIAVFAKIKSGQEVVPMNCVFFSLTSYRHERRTCCVCCPDMGAPDGSWVTFCVLSGSGTLDIVLLYHRGSRHEPYAMNCC